MSTVRLFLIVFAVLAIAACREPDGPVGPSGGSRTFVNSDPPGGRIIVDGTATGLVTPDTVRGLVGRHDVTVQLDTFDTSYGFTARVFLGESDSITVIDGPLVMRCGDAVCWASQFRHYSANRVRFASNPVGSLFLETGNGDGVIWPSLTNNSYVSGGMVAFAGIINGTDTVATGMYDHHFLAGRPVPLIEQVQDRIDLFQTTWILPPSAALQSPTVRGIRVSEHATAISSIDDVVVLRLIFRNITNERLYAALDPAVPPGGLTFEKVWIGYMLDPDIGEPTDDLFSYEADEDLVFAYDSEFHETDFGGGFNRSPGLIGLRLFDAPAGTTVSLNGWMSQGVTSRDWTAGQITEPIGWKVLSGTQSFAPDHDSFRIGHLPQSKGDARITVAAGPLRLAPGDSASVSIAIVLAEPVPGTFASGQEVEPGEPLDPGRQLRAVAANLIERAIAATGVTGAKPRGARSTPGFRRE